MNNNSWNRRPYARAMNNPEDSGGGASEVENGGRSDGRQNLASKARLQGVELQREAARKKVAFQQKMSLEGRRRKLGCGNLVNFLLGNTILHEI